MARSLIWDKHQLIFLMIGISGVMSTCSPDQENCECDGSNPEDLEHLCKRTSTSEVCEGRGLCVCGFCDCDAVRQSNPSQRYSGPYCECDDYSCDYYDNKICSGPDHGECRCGECICEHGFRGSACECPISNESCVASNGLICNGKGLCVCGKCACTIDTFFRGPTCEDCPTCSGRCGQEKECVQCKVFNTGPHTAEYCAANCNHVNMVSEIADDPSVLRTCRYTDDDGCRFYFAYEYDSNRVFAQITKDSCGQQVTVTAGNTSRQNQPQLGIIMGLTLLWKLLTTTQD